MTLPVSGGVPPSLAKRILDHIEETCGVRSDLMIHDYGGEGYADGVHRKDCRWCALLAEEYAQRDPFKRAAVGGVPEQGLRDPGDFEIDAFVYTLTGIPEAPPGVDDLKARRRVVREFLFRAALERPRPALPAPEPPELPTKRFAHESPSPLWLSARRFIGYIGDVRAGRVKRLDRDVVLSLAKDIEEAL